MTEPEKLEAGAVVVLKSGGPRMAVRSINTHEGDAGCVWFAEGYLQNGEFKLETLRAAIPGDVHYYWPD